MKTLARKVNIPNNARNKVYHDTQEIVQNDSVINFFPANASRSVTRDNYVNNPFPGQEERMIVGLSFELIKQFITTDSANSIDAFSIVNELKDAGVILTADNNYKEFLRVTLEDHFNFAGTGVDVDVAVASDGGTPATASVAENETVNLKSPGKYDLPDPFVIAPTQAIDLKVQFNDASNFPTQTNWDDSSQSRLYMRANLYVAEIEPNQGNG